MAEPLQLTVNPRLDIALQSGWDAWYPAAMSEGREKVAIWLARRLHNPALKSEVSETLESAFGSSDLEDRALALSELAEIAEGHDDLVADTLWEGVLAAGRELGDPDMIYESIARLAGIAEDHDEFLAAAEYYLEFLHWRRQPDHESDPDAVASAFEEIVRLAEIDGDRRAAAVWEFRSARFVRLVTRDDERALTGDWEDDPAPYTSWA